MVIQIVVSFGHAHRIEGFRQTPLLPQVPAGIHSQSATEPGDPASNPVGPAFEYCAICVVINMGASALPVETPASGVPVIVSKIRFSPHADAAAWTFGHLLFQARAPPFV